MSTTTIVLIIAAVLSLPGGLFVASLLSQPSTRWLSIFGGLIGAAAIALSLQLLVVRLNILIDMVAWFFGAFLACSTGVAMGALLVNFLFLRRGGRASASAQES